MHKVYLPKNVELIKSINWHNITKALINKILIDNLLICHNDNILIYYNQMSPNLMSLGWANDIREPDTAEILYTGVVRSMAVYGGTMWGEALTFRNKVLLRRPQGVIVVRAVRRNRKMLLYVSAFSSRCTFGRVCRSVPLFFSAARMNGTPLCLEESRTIRGLSQEALT